MNPEVILFDAAGTLMHLAEPVGAGYARVARRHGFSPDAAELTRIFARQWREIPPPQHGLNGPAHDDDRAWWRALVGAVLAEAAVDTGEVDVDAYFDDLYSHYAEPDAWRLFPEVTPVLRQLSGADGGDGFRLAVASNFDQRLIRVLDGLGIAGFFELIHVSSQLGVSKPDIRFFQLVVEASGVPAASHLHVGDDPEYDWAAARRAGLHTFPLDRPKNDLHGLRDRLRQD